MSEPSIDTATFAAGCFWGVEETFRRTPGVLTTEVGYLGGHTENPTYKDVCYKNTGHAEAVRMTFDPAVITYDQLLDIFFTSHNPTQLNRQGPDVGDQYRSAVFFHSPAQAEAARAAIVRHQPNFSRPIVTQVVEDAPFTLAEEYHQKYLLKRGASSCHI